MTSKPTVLFVCHHNANRSQIAAAYPERLATDDPEGVRVGSAPRRPAYDDRSTTTGARLSI